MCVVCLMCMCVKYVSRETVPGWAAIISNKHWADSRDASHINTNTRWQHCKQTWQGCAPYMQIFPLLCTIYNDLSETGEQIYCLWLHPSDSRLWHTSNNLHTPVWTQLPWLKILFCFSWRFSHSLFVELQKTRFLSGHFQLHAHMWSGW